MKNRPNILFIMVDNMPAELLGCYGNDEIHTPHIDNLAQGGIQFDGLLPQRDVLALPCIGTDWSNAFTTWRSHLARRSRYAPLARKMGCHRRV